MEQTMHLRTALGFGVHKPVWSVSQRALVRGLYAIVVLSHERYRAVCRV
jgi:hypothetical protein